MPTSAPNPSQKRAQWIIHEPKLESAESKTETVL